VKRVLDIICAMHAVRKVSAWCFRAQLGAVYTCPNLRTNRHTIPCTIC
jgi:hypothetical protein